MHLGCSVGALPSHALFNPHEVIATEPTHFFIDPLEVASRPPLPA